MVSNKNNNCFVIQKETQKVSLCLDGFNNSEQRFIQLFAKSLKHFKINGTLALYSVPFELHQIIMVSAWFAGWTVAIIPSYKKPIINTHLSIDMLVSYATLDDIDAAIKLTVCHEDSCNNTLFDWVENQKLVSDKLDSYVWSDLETAIVLFTSGSTGVPKGICHSIQNLIRSGERFCQHFDIKQRDKILNSAAIHTMSGIRISIILPLLKGCDVMGIDEQFSFLEMVDIINSEKPNILITGPNIINQISLLASKLQSSFESINFILSTGAQLHRVSRVKIFESLNIPVLDYYGLTETCGLSLAENINDFHPQNNSLGKACSDIKLRVSDENNELHSVGEGELVIFSDSLFLGYLGEKQSKSTHFKTGDLFQLNDDGNARYVRRISQGFKSSVTTQWVYPDVLEAFIRQNSKVTDIHMSLFHDNLSRLGFNVEVEGIDQSQWQVWLGDILNKINIEFGDDYKMTRWVCCEKIIRSNLGKYLSSY